MTPAFPYLFEIGLVQLLWNFSVPELALGLYAIILVGFGIQYVLLRKVRHPAGRWAFAAVLLLGVPGCEVGFNLAGGWDRLGVIFIYGGVFCLILGCLLGAAVYYWKRKTDRSA